MGGRLTEARQPVCDPILIPTPNPTLHSSNNRLNHLSYSCCAIESHSPTASTNRLDSNGTFPNKNRRNYRKFDDFTRFTSCQVRCFFLMQWKQQQIAIEILQTSLLRSENLKRKLGSCRCCRRVCLSSPGCVFFSLFFSWMRVAGN